MASRNLPAIAGGNAEIHNIGLDLYNKKITFGEANKRIQEYGNDIRARLIPIIKQYQAEIAAQKAANEQQVLQRQEASNRQAAQEQANARAQYAQEQALRQQRAQMFLTTCKLRGRRRYKYRKCNRCRNPIIRTARPTGKAQLA